jgi:hypothetical protein
MFIFGILAAVAGSILFHDTILLCMRPRLFIWQALFTGMRGNWFTGNGALQALSAIEDGLAQLINGDMKSYMPASQVDFVHNDYLQAMSEGGAAGLVSFLAIVVCTLKKAYRASSRVTRAAGLAFLALCINGLGESPLQVPVTFYSWFFFAGVIWFDDAASSVFTLKNQLAIKTIFFICLSLFLAEGGRQALGNYFWAKSGTTETLLQQKKYLEQAAFFLPEAGNVQTEHAKALERSRQHAQARSRALRAMTVKFDYDDLYIIAEAETSLHLIDPVTAWKDISGRFPCLNYPRLKLARYYLQNKQFELARQECDIIMSGNCLSVNPGQPYTSHAARILKMIDDSINK